MIRSVVLLIVSILWISCGVHRGEYSDRSEIDFDLYCKLNDTKSISENLQHLVSESSLLLKRVIIFGNHSYVFDRHIEFDGLRDSIVFRGKEKTIFYLDTPLMTIKAKHEKEFLSSSLYRHDSKIEIGRLSTEPEDLICLRSDKVVETSWNSVANDIHRVISVSGETIGFGDSLNFNYSVGANVILYKKAYVQFEDLEFVIGRDVSYILSVTGCSVSFSDCLFNSSASNLIHSLIQLNDCETVHVDRIIVEGSITYGFLINNTRNVDISNVTSRVCLQPIVPATWSDNIEVDRMHCIGSVIDAHPSFNVKYRNVTIEDGVMYWNVRALGVVLENCMFQILEGIDQASIYLGVVNLSPEYAFLSGEYDVVCNNVEWIYKDLGFNGLHVHHCRRFFVDECVTHAVSVGPDVSDFQILKSRVGRVSSADSNYSVDSTSFEASLQRNNIIRSPLNCSNTGNLRVINCSFVGYESQFLFDYIHWPTTTITLENCQFCDFQGFVNRTFLPKETYKSIYVIEKDHHYNPSLFNDVKVNNNLLD